MPHDGDGVAAVEGQLQEADDDPRQRGKADAGRHAAQGRRFQAEAVQHRVQHQVIERDQQHYQHRVQRLHLRRQEPAWFFHGVRLHDPRRGLLVEQREERRDEGEDDEDAQHGAHAFDGFVGVDAACAFQLHGRADAAEGQQQYQRGTRGNHEAPFGNAVERIQGADHADVGHIQAGTRTAIDARQQGGAGDAGKRVGIRRRRRHVHVFLGAHPEDEGGGQHHQARDAEGDRGTEVAQEHRHQQRGEERAEVDDPVKQVEDQLGLVLVGLVELVADKRGHQRLDAAGTEGDQEQAEIEAVDAVFKQGQAGMAGAIHETEPENGVVLAEEAVGQPAAQQREEIHADDEGVEHVLGFARALVDRDHQQQGADEERRQDVAHAVKAEAFAAFVGDDVRYLPRHFARGGLCLGR